MSATGPSKWFYGGKQYSSARGKGLSTHKTTPETPKISKKLF